MRAFDVTNKKNGDFAREKTKLKTKLFFFLFGDSMQREGQLDAPHNSKVEQSLKKGLK
jgi:hypothetical protein